MKKLSLISNIVIRIITRFIVHLIPIVLNRFKARVEGGGVLEGRGRGESKKHRNSVETYAEQEMHVTVRD